MIARFDVWVLGRTVGCEFDNLEPLCCSDEHKWPFICLVREIGHVRVCIVFVCLLGLKCVGTFFLMNIGDLLFI